MSKRRFTSNDAERRKWQDPEKILTGAGLQKGMTFIDVGCGEGYFSIPASHIVGTKGHVYAYDINEEAIRNLAIQVRNEHLDNLTPLTGSGEETIIGEACADMVFFGIDLHDFDDPQKVLMNAKIMLKPEGYLVDLDWKDQHMEFGPPADKRFSLSKAVGLIESAGFRVISTADAGPYHYLVIAGL
jgi:ubiquinone/menaquinone biosynthesis C-methylase UbiE